LDLTTNRGTAEMNVDTTVDAARLEARATKGKVGTRPFYRSSPAPPVSSLASLLFISGWRVGEISER
jgi:hypothetical protein